ncbi:hypothetical protein FLONG3_5212 [Fusarium longipes]|uniref:Glycosyl transferase CAP10 domain-containing protein n=1 Tax=Fusarium longipes TaxID=694270 RepID=A0A395SVQ2_9HYPO|nr:hypothetical protein FLONG3_5212 [Fusarium longipes]
MLASRRVDPAACHAAGAILFTTLAQYVQPKRSELLSEILCWGILPLVFRVISPAQFLPTSPTGPLNESKKPEQSKVSQWLIAAAVTASAFFKAESNAIGFYPTLTPLLLTIHTYLASDKTYSDIQIPSAYINTIRGAILASIPAVVSLSNGDLFGALASIILVLSLLVLYSLLTPGFKLRVSSIDIEACIDDICIRINKLLFVAIAAQVFIIGTTTSDTVTILLSAAFKAASWYFTIQIAQQKSWSIAPAIGTFALACTRSSFSQTFQLQAISHILVSAIALFQTIHLLPTHSRGKSIIWFFLLASILPFLLNEYKIYESQSAALNTFSDATSHPVEMLAEKALGQFESRIANQSETYEAAVAEYKRRYRIDPPLGFYGWFQFARKHQSPIIDDFDMIHKSISPLMKRSGKEIVEMMTKLHETPEAEVWLCDFTGKTARTKCRHQNRVYDRHYSFLFDKLLWNMLGVLPDVKLLINHFDEPRVISQIPNGREDIVVLTDKSKRPTWSTLTGTCSASKRVSEQAEDSVETFGLPFVQDHMATSDLCRNPEYIGLQGAFISPKTFKIIEGLVPVLSTGSFSTMGDVLFPSPAYIEKEFLYDESRDVPWPEKANNLYWRGSTTGGYAQDRRWRDFQRQRFVAMAQNLSPDEHLYLRKKDDSVNVVKSRFLNERLFDVGFTRIFQCERRFCRDQSKYFDVKSWADKDKALGSKLAFDLDGNGISGRYYKLLASKSLPLKQALLREWHDERLMPWVHYIPVSQSLKELPELVTFLTSTETGQRLAEEIANRGRDWMGKAVREIDMTVYLYRLLLELARLQDPTRKAL